MKYDPNFKLPPRWRWEECQNCGDQFIVIGPSAHDNPDWRGCPICQSKDVKVMRSPSKKARR